MIVLVITNNDNVSLYLLKCLSRPVERTRMGPIFYPYASNLVNSCFTKKEEVEYKSKNQNKQTVDVLHHPRNNILLQYQPN
jgi:hypothetical protein